MKAVIRNTEKAGISRAVQRACLKYGISKAFITKADSYLHYSNQILSGISGSIISACILLVIHFKNRSIVLKPFLNIPEQKEHLYYIEFIEIASSFDGVIERYCGVPP